jgi:hypothetical protein
MYEGLVVLPPCIRSCNRRAGVVLEARRRGGKGGAWTNRRRKNAPPVEFDKYGLPIPPKKSQKELEEEHEKYMESLAPEGGFEEFDPATLGLKPEDLDHDPFLEEPSDDNADYEPDWDNIPQFAGEFNGADDPLDAPWRLATYDVVAKVRTDRTRD